jgi:hypothetical protein
MKIIFRDFLIILTILNIWIVAIFYAPLTGKDNLLEILYAFPGHLLITIGYYAVCNVCYSILFISDCENEYQELMDQLDEGRKFFKDKNINYN